jgi:hypothetical protein
VFDEIFSILTSYRTEKGKKKRKKPRAEGEEMKTASTKKEKTKEK